MKRANLLYRIAFGLWAVVAVFLLVSMAAPDAFPFLSSLFGDVGSGLVLAMAAQAPFQFDPQLTAVANAYKNEELIGDRVLPIIRVSQETYKYLKLPQGETFMLPDDTRTGRKGQPDQVEFSALEETGKVYDYGLDAPVPNKDVEQAASGANMVSYDPRARAATMVTNIISLRREVRTAGVVFAAANYPVANKTTLSGSTQWSHADSDPIRTILTTMDGMIMRPNVMVVGQEVATALMTHPKIISAFNRNDGENGVVQLSFLAQILGLSEILVGRGWYNTANPGQNPSISRAWGKHAALLHRDMNAAADFPTTWGAQFLWPHQGSDFISGVINDPDMGLTGGVRIRSGLRYNNHVIAPSFGYLFINAAA